MKIAVSSQNFRSVTGHAGKSRRFIIYDVGTPCDKPKTIWLDLPNEMAFHEFSGGKHPLDEMDMIVTASAGPGFISKMAQRGIQVVISEERDPDQAVRDCINGMDIPEATRYCTRSSLDSRSPACCGMDM